MDANNDNSRGDSLLNPPAPPAVLELVAACTRFVTTRYQIPLDGTPDTLSLIDQYVRDSRAEIAANPAAIELVQGAIGAYLGEVMRQSYGGEWFAVGDQDGWRIDMTYVFVTFNPIGMAREALTLEPAEGWHAHLETEEAYREEIDARLAALGDVTEEEYYAPTTQFDVLALTVESIRARMAEQNLGDVTFNRSDYGRK